MLSKVRYKGLYYGILRIKDDIPVILDYDDYCTIRLLDKEWLLDDKSNVYCVHTHNNISKNVYLDEVIMTIVGNVEDKSIEHINTYKIDNRRVNLQYKNHKNYVKKKVRTNDFGDLPSFIYYIKNEDRFMVKLKDYSWKTSSSKQKTNKEKLNEAKSHLSELRNIRPELFEHTHMNGDVNNIDLYVSLYKIIKRAGYDYEIIIPTLQTEKLLKVRKKSNTE